MSEFKLKYPLIDILFGGVDFKDYPDFCDAYIESAYWNTETEHVALSDEELDELNDDSMLVLELLYKKLY